MQRNLLGALGAAVIVIGVFAYSSFFIVNQNQQALVLQLGEPKRVIQQPGLNFKLPFVQNVQYFEKRVLDLDPPKQQVILVDQKRIDVDTYSRFRIADPLRFFQTVTNEAGARARLSAIISSSLRRILGGETLTSILSAKRAEIMAVIRSDVNQAVKPLGIEIVDVRMKRADYPEQTSQAIFNRMKSEREREAREFRAEGFEVAQQIRADADRQRIVILATAQREAQTQRGQGDAQAIQIYADAFGKDAEFFAFYRSMEAYRDALNSNSTTMVLTPDSDFFRYFGDPTGRAGGTR
ncbi:MAG: protease modulator HflC [Proteobacteria bacterium]|nr:protease modulator HflC [Pseudomonadota bacterium]MBI3499758.1 protease modulator HflC [Pseudomonadota bacterium]